MRPYDVAFFEASIYSPETNRQLAEMLDLPHPILGDPEKKVARAYGVVTDERPVPRRWTFYIGTDGRILYIDKQVTADGHGEEVPARLKELGIARLRGKG